MAHEMTDNQLRQLFRTPGGSFEEGIEISTNGPPESSVARTTPESILLLSDMSHALLPRIAEDGTQMLRTRDGDVVRAMAGSPGRSVP